MASVAADVGDVGEEQVLPLSAAPSSLPTLPMNTAVLNTFSGSSVKA